MGKLRARSASNPPPLLLSHPAVKLVINCTLLKVLIVINKINVSEMEPRHVLMESLPDVDW